MKKVTLGILAHVDAGKTTLSESLLYLTGSIRSMGRVDHQDTFLDTNAQERQRGITIFSKQARIQYKDMQIVLLDTPGHVDFSAEMERTLSVLDYAILVISGLDGVQGHTKTLWRLLQQYHVPTFIFVNKMDITHKTRDELLNDVKLELDSNCIDFYGGDFQDGISADVNEQCLEELSMCNETMLEAYLEQGEIGVEDIAEAIAHREVFPVLWGSALKNNGVEELLETLNQHTREKTYPKEFAARVFKIGRDDQGNRLTHLKITGGSLTVKDSIIEKSMTPGQKTITESNIVSENNTVTEKVNQIRLYSGDKCEAVEEVYAGEICTITGLTATYPGEGLGTEEELFLPILEPVLNYQMIPPKEINPFTMLRDVRILEEEDPLLHVEWKEELQALHVSLMGPVQIQILQQEIKERFGYVVTFGEGNIVYKESIAEAIEGVGHFEPLRHYAEVHVLLEPLPQGSGMEFAINCREDELDKNWQRLIYTHLEEKEHLGVLTGSAITDIRITLIAGRAHKKHTEGGDFRQATYRAIRQGLKKAQSILLEPYYKVTLKVPTEYVGRAMSDLQAMHGSFDAPDMEGEYSILCGRTPVSEMTGYPTEVAAYTGGRGTVTLELLGYFPCHNSDAVVEHIAYDSERDVENPTGSVFCAHGAGYIVPWFEVEEKMHVESPLLASVSEEEMLTIVAAKNASRPVQEREYDGYGGLESDLEEIFVREFGEIKRRLPSQDTQIRNYDAHKAAVQQYKNTHADKKQPKQKKRYFLVDGYNVIFAWDDLKELAKTNLDSARGKLMDEMCNYQGFIGSELILVFDAYKVKDNPGEVMDYHNIHVVYTREAETADAYIERVTHEIAREHDVTVATSDGLEQMIVIGEGARRMSSRELLEDVRRVTAEGLENYRKQ